ncbi:MAG TPA: metallophosphoesterase family protein [bacterium]|nr:metallophosphoesterase family protein [bacterium]
MKTLVISDTHLASVFNKKKFVFLKELIDSCDKLIMNGDFWCGYSFHFDDFLRSKWSDLFPVMHKKKTTFIYGNHDIASFMDERADRFSLEQRQSTTLDIGDTLYHIEHGDIFFKKRYYTADWYMQLHRSIRLNTWFNYPLETLLFKTVPIKTYSALFGILNTTIKNNSRHLRGDRHILVTGHTHLPEYNPDSHFVNTGCISFGIASYLMFHDARPEFVTMKY